MSQPKELCNFLDCAAKTAIEQNPGSIEKQQLWEKCEQSLNQLGDVIINASHAGTLGQPNNISYYKEWLDGLRSNISALFDKYPNEDIKTVKKGAPDNYGHYLHIIENAVRSE